MCRIARLERGRSLVVVLLAIGMLLGLAQIGYAVYIGQYGGSKSYAPTEGYYYGDIVYDAGKRYIIPNTSFRYGTSRVSYIQSLPWGQRAAMSFDNQPMVGLSALSWCSTNLPGPDYWRDDDNGDGNFEEAKVSITDPGGLSAGTWYNYTVWFLDKQYPPTRSEGDMNVSAYKVLWRARLDSEWLKKFHFTNYDGIW